MANLLADVNNFPSLTHAELPQVLRFGGVDSWSNAMSGQQIVTRSTCCMLPTSDEILPLKQYTVLRLRCAAYRLQMHGRILKIVFSMDDLQML